MKTIVAGSRGIDVYRVVAAAIGHARGQGLSGGISTVVSGTARGVDRLGEQWAAERSVPVERFAADWETFGKSAGFRRNEQMLAVADAVVAVWDGESRGTAQLIHRARQLGKEVHVYIFSGGKLRRDRQLSQGAGAAQAVPNAQADPDDDDAWWKPQLEYWQDHAVIDWDELRDDGMGHGAAKRLTAAEAERQGRDVMRTKLGYQDDQRCTEGVGEPAILCCGCGRPTGAHGQVKRSKSGKTYCLPCAEREVQRYYERHPERKPRPLGLTAAERRMLRRKRDGAVEEVSDRYVARYHVSNACWLIADTKSRRWLDKEYASFEKAEARAAYLSMQWEAQQVSEHQQQDKWRLQGALWTERTW